MKSLILLSLLFCSISCQFLGRCTGTPKKRPIECFYGQVLNEDIPELKELLEKYRDGDDHEFADYLGDMIDKKEFREGKTENSQQKPIILGRCGVAPKYLPFACYERNVLRRNRNQLKEAYDTLHGTNLPEFNKVYFKLVETKRAYFAPKLIKY